MTDPAIGDIVVVDNRDGTFVVIEPAVSSVPPGRRWKVRNIDTDFDVIVGDGDLSLLLRPDLGVGDTLKLDGYDVTIVSFNHPFVTVAVPPGLRREALYADGEMISGHVAFGAGRIGILYGEAIRQNAPRLLAQA